MLVIFFLGVIPTQAQETILIRNGKLFPIVGEQIPRGCLLIQKGRIAKIGTEITPPPGTLVIDAEGNEVYPGFIALMTAVGVTGYPGTGDDLNELGVSTPHIDPYDAINPEDDTIEVTRMGGVTTVMTISGTLNVINGKSVVLNLEGDLAEEMVIKRDVAQIFNMGAKGQVPYGPKRPGNYPQTHPGIAAFIREKLQSALEYARKAREKDKKIIQPNFEEDYVPFRRDLEMEALVPVVEKKVPALFITQNEVTLRNALNIIHEFDLKGILYATADILKFSAEIAQKKIPVIWAGTTSLPKKWEPFDLNFRTASVLAEKGILFCFDQLGFLGVNSHNVRNIFVPASLSVAHGLEEKEALKALTINPAKILGMESEIGSLEVGKRANITIWSGSPIQMSSRVLKVIIDGKLIPMTSIQTRLRDKFEKIVQDRMEKKRTKKVTISGENKLF